jgi:predicted Fe-Mo cluster-binding NifX family protein
MRIAVSAQTSNGLDSMVAQHFGRCPYFALVDVDDNEVQAIEVIDNPYYAGHQAGEVPQFIHDHQANVMLSGGMGGRAIQIFASMGINTATGAAGTVRETLESYLGGELREAAPCADSVAHGHGHDHDHVNQDIIDALERVEHPSIAASLLNLGMLRDYTVSDDHKVILTLVLPFPNVPDNIRDHMVNSLAVAAQSAGGQLVEVGVAFMNEEEQQKFLALEQQNWRG